MSRSIQMAAASLISLLFAAAVLAEAPATAPAGATAQCKDGTYYTNPTKSGACRGHQGVKTWLGAAAPAAAPAAATRAPKAATPAPSASISTAGAAPTVTCKDGSTDQGGRGACRGHGGVAKAGAAPTTAATTPMPAPAAPAVMPPSRPAMGAPAAGSASPASAAKPKAFTPPTVAAVGGGNGKVWANKNSKVYHCATSRWYGKTKDGSYMSEADAKAQGFKADHGKACQ